MIKTLIIEDEEYIRKGMIKIIQKLDKNIHIVGDCDSVSEGLRIANLHKPDLVLLDVNLQGETGFDFVNQASHLKFKLIFVTAYHEHALQALKCGAVDYLLKPVDSNEIDKAIESSFSQKCHSIPQQVEIANETYNGKKERIVLSLFECYQVINFKDLTYCKSDKGYTTFYLSDGRQFTASKPLKEFEEQLPQNSFIRTHQSYIVNISFVDKFDKCGLIVLKQGNQIPVSASRKEAVVSLLFC